MVDSWSISKKRQGTVLRLLSEGIQETRNRPLSLSREFRRQGTVPASPFQGIQETRNRPLSPFQGGIVGAKIIIRL